MTSVYDKCSPENILERASKLGADQITFRKLYSNSNESEKGGEINKWIKNNKMEANAFGRLRDFVRYEGEPLEVLPFGAKKYSHSGIGMVMDEDCMSKEFKDTYKYLILREDCRLYSRWDDKGSLIF
jgi:hypothetical protein